MIMSDYFEATYFYKLAKELKKSELNFSNKIIKTH